MIIAQRPFLRRDFAKLSYAVVDTSATSPNYFDISYFPDTIGAGKSLIKFKGNGTNLAMFKQVEVEVLDVVGNAVRTEIVPMIDRFGDYFASMYVYDNTAEGLGAVYIVGVAKADAQGNPLGSESLNELGYNVIWGRSIKILPTERNDSELIFDEAPTITLAQVITPAKISNNLSTDVQFTMTSASGLTIVTSNFKDFDKKTSTSRQIQDASLRDIKIHPNSIAATTNTVDTLPRVQNKSVIGGYQLNDYKKHNTVALSSTSFFSSSHVGGYLEFYSSSYTLQPSIATNSTLATVNPYNELVTQDPQSITSQLDNWTSTIVKVINDKTAVLETPVQVSIRTPKTDGTYVNNVHTYKAVTKFTASLTYTDNSQQYITSSVLSQSFLQVTCFDVRPIGGDVHRMKTYYKRSALSQDWTPLGDQQITPPEYLTDASNPNQTSYARTLSDSQLIGHFTDPTILNDNWNLYNETPTGFDTSTGSITRSPYMDSVLLRTSGTTYKILTTQFYQNYLVDQTYTYSQECAIGPYTDLEVYMTSDPLSTTLIAQDFLPKAFDKSANKQKSRYGDNYSRFGKYLGKITNTTNQTINYGRVVFDFLTDRDGLGRPLLRCIPNTAAYTGSAYVSKLSITPRKLNGFTPELIQLTLPLPLDIDYGLSESIDYKFEYYDYKGRQSEYVSYVNDVRAELVSEIQNNKCQAEQKSFNFTSQYWISASYTPLNALVQGLTVTQATTGNYSTNTRLYPMFINGAVGSVLGSYVGGAAEATPVDGWNCAIPINDGLYGTTALNSAFRYVSSSLTYTNMVAYKNAGTYVTTSWRWFDSFTDLFNTGPGLSAALQTWAYRSSSISSVDNARFVTHSCVGIRRTDASQSYADFNKTGNTAARTVALKQRRLVWPTGGPITSSYFTENGGIYNVKFKLKRTGSYEPDSGSYLMVYVFDAFKNFTTSSIGTAGWYPPSRNIVKVGHGYTSGSITTPTITWYDSATGFNYDEYDVNIVQYGSPAQLVFEPSGDNNLYFGTLVDDIQFCKVGVTTDPNFIKPQSVTTFKKLAPGSSPYIPSR
jgi:hypothetical protein